MRSIPIPGSIIPLCASVREAALSFQVSIRTDVSGMWSWWVRSAGWCPPWTLAMVTVWNRGQLYHTGTQCIKYFYSCMLMFLVKLRRKMSGYAALEKRLQSMTISAFKRWITLANKYCLCRWDSAIIRIVLCKVLQRHLSWERKTTLNCFTNTCLSSPLVWVAQQILHLLCMIN